MQTQTDSSGYEAPLDKQIDLERLRKRTSEKWEHYPPEVLPVFVAESDFPLAAPIAERVKRAIDDGDTGYATGKGVGEGYAAFARRRYGLEIDPTDVSVVPEVMIGVAEILRACLSPGDRVLITPPVYPPFFDTIAEVRCTVDEAPLKRDGEAFELDLEAIERSVSAGARAVLLCNPHNPVGRVYSRDDLTAVARIAEANGAIVICDEIHAPLVMPGVHFTPFSEIARETGVTAITLTSASKGWNIAGLKCAILVAHGDEARTIVARLPKVMPERASHLGVLATIAALEECVGYLDEVVDHLDVMRKNLRAILDDAGLRDVQFAMPQAGYLAWLDCTRLGLKDPAATFYKEGAVALVPGVAFGKDYRQWARLNFATSTAIVAEAARRMAKALNGG